MNMLRIAGLILLNLIVTITAIWMYDTYKSKKLATESARVASLAQSNELIVAKQREHLSYAFRAIAGLKPTVEELFQARGTFPDSNAAVGIRKAEDFRSEVISSVEVTPGGVITAKFVNFPEVADGWLRFTPKVSSGGGFLITWRCETNIGPVRRMAPTCELI